MTNRITVAENAGFCFGVRRAVDTVESLIAELPGAQIVTLGDLIHNPDVLRDLASRGVETVSPDRVSELCRNRGNRSLVFVIRAHGCSRETEEQLTQAAKDDPGIRVVDCTCPFVKKIHRIAETESEPYREDPDGMVAVIFGDPSHPEVEGIASRFRCAVRIFPDSDAVLAWTASEDGKRWTEKPLIFVSQTTQKLSDCYKTKNILQKLYTKARFFDTICSVTENRQEEAEQIAKASDVMLVVGGKASSNTAKLYDICRQACPRTYWIERAEELSEVSFPPACVAGITAGASTPDSIIQEVGRTMSEMMEENFAQLLDESFKPLNTGDVVKGIVTSISANEIHLDIGQKVTGILAFSDVTDDPTVDVASLFHIGDEVEAMAIRVSDVDGVATLSKKKIDNANNWSDILAAYKEGTLVSGKVIDALEKGVIVSVKGMRIFVPASHSSIPRDGNLGDLVGTVQKIKIIDVNETRRRAVGSIREALRDERRAKAAEFWNNIEVGQEFDGVVKSFESYGAFVDLGGVDGMVHTTELSWKRIRHPSEVVSIGDPIHVFVKALDLEKHRISLGYKTDETNPWKAFLDRYQVGDVATVRVVSMMPFGAFAEILPGVDGLIHISQIADRRINAPAEVLSIGQEVDVKITGIDEERQRISLSIRALSEDAGEGFSEEAEEEEFSEEGSAEEAESEEAPAEEVPAEDVPAEEPAADVPAEEKSAEEAPAEE
ncbi:MAG: bifunctional 4-hydroxy-3-methylbut-2-enyl diphosphate reductase/30S ribosomal protein S1 [Clostridia bacterium]|nr:bifunctional 4-hydroxy-3-methylbut-2-enyl diphosphate reductase/30S ribosomal protein S1 [Clostridia bacterium]